MAKFKLAPKVDKIDGLPESVRSAYKPAEDGKGFVLSGEVELDDPEELRSSLTAERTKNRQFEQKYKDIDPDRYKELEKERAEREEQEASREKDVDKRIKRVQETEQEKTRAAEAKAEKAEKRAENMAIRSAINAAVAGAKGRLKLLQDHLRSRAKPVAKGDDDYEVRVLDADGSERIGKSGQPMLMDEYLESLKADADWGHAFEGSGGAGGGAPGQNDRNRQHTGEDAWKSKAYGDMTEADKIKATDGLGPTQWRRFVQAATRDKKITPAAFLEKVA